MSVIHFGDLDCVREKHKDKRIVFCSGCFDLTHADHAAFFEECKKLGDILVVMVARDCNVQNNKGDERPILGEEPRLKMVDSLKPVDFSFLDIPFEKGKPFVNLSTVFQALRPDVYVINDDAFDIPSRGEIVRECGVTMKVLIRSDRAEFFGISTTAIIEKIRGTELLFEEKKRKYFTRLGFQVRRALALHKTAGLWDRNDGKRDWNNISEHCLVEAARVNVLADFLGLSRSVRDDLVLAAALHDFSKKQEVIGIGEAVKRGASQVEAVYKIGEEKTARLRASGFSERVIRLANAPGALPENSLEVRDVLDQNVPSDEDLAFLVMYYVDAYTRDSEWTEVVSFSGENDLDRRISRNLKNYAEVGRLIAKERAPDEPLFAEKTLDEVMGEFGHEIERRFALMTYSKTGRLIRPVQLPEVIDDNIRKRIEHSY